MPSAPWNSVNAHARWANYFLSDCCPKVPCAIDTLGSLRSALINPLEMLLRTRFRSITVVREMLFWRLRRDMRMPTTPV